MAVNAPTRVLYTAQSTATGDGRSGHVASDDGIVDVDLVVPRELGGPGGGTNPEQLFASGYAGCFHSALRRVARAQDVDVTGSTVTARVGIGPNADRGFSLTVALAVHLPNAAREAAERAVAAAHRVCPYSNATRGNIDVELSVV